MSEEIDALAVKSGTMIVDEWLGSGLMWVAVQGGWWVTYKDGKRIKERYIRGTFVGPAVFPKNLTFGVDAGKM